MKSDAEKLHPFLGDIYLAATESGWDPHIIAAICLRESGAGTASHYEPKGPWGVHADGHGHGLMGIDDRYHQEYCNRVDASVPLNQFRYCVRLLRQNRSYFQMLPSVPSANRALLLNLTLAAYNCGPANARRGWLLEGDPDHRTTGKDYGRWIQAKAADLRAIVPGIFASVEKAKSNA